MDKTRRGFPLELMKRTINDGYFLVNDNSYSNVSEPVEITGNVTDQVLVSPSDPANQLVIKAITIVCEDQLGEVRVHGEDGKLYLPAYVSVQNRASASGALNIVLPPGESLLLSTIDRGATSRTFVGVSYIEVNSYD